MNDQNNNHDLVDQAVAEMLAEPMPDGPSPMVAARTLAALKEPFAPSKSTLFTRLNNIRVLYKVAAAIALLLCATATILIFNRVGGGTVAFAEVARKLRESRTLSCIWTMDMPSTGKPVSMKMTFMEPGKLRMEMPGIATTIVDTAKNKLLVLNTPIRTALLNTPINIAFVVDLGAAGTAPPNQATEMADWIEKIKNTSGQQAQNIGEKMIDGIEAKGFLLSEQGMDYTVWADARTGTPLRIEIPLNLPSMKTTVVMSNLVFDERLDEKSFDVTPPPGYMQVKLDLPIFQGAAGEDDIVELLRWYADKSQGSFPKALDNWIDFHKVSKHPGQRPDQKELMGVMMHVGRASVFLSTLSPEKYGYFGADVKLGEKSKIVFWYHVGATDSYRAIFGDLRIEDIKREQIPPTPTPSLP